MMKSKFLTGVTAGVMLATAAGMMMAPQLSKGTKRRLRKTGKSMMHNASNMYDGIMHMIK